MARCRWNNVGTFLQLHPWHAVLHPLGLLRAMYFLGSNEFVTCSLLPKTHHSNPKTVLGVGLARDRCAGPRRRKAEGEMCTDSNTTLQLRLPMCTQALEEG